MAKPQDGPLAIMPRAGAKDPLLKLDDAAASTGPLGPQLGLVVSTKITKYMFISAKL